MNIFVTAPDVASFWVEHCQPIERQSFAYDARVVRAVRRPVGSRGAAYPRIPDAGHAQGMDAIVNLYAAFNCRYSALGAARRWDAALRGTYDAGRQPRRRQALR